MKYYLKNNSTIPVKLPGHTIEFAAVDILAGMRRGVYMTDDPSIQQQLSSEAGVREISQSDYSHYAAKKKPWTSLIAFDPNNQRELEPKSVVEEPSKPEPKDVEEKFASITEVEDIEEGVKETLDPEFVKNYDDLSELLGEPVEKLKELAKEGAPKRQGFKGHNVSLWREYLYTD